MRTRLENRKGWYVLLSERKPKIVTYEGKYKFYWFEWMHVWEFMHLWENQYEIMQYLVDHYKEDFLDTEDWHKEHQRVITQIYSDINDND